MAEAFLQAGARVSLWDIDQKAVDEAKARLAKATGAADRIDGAVVDAMSEASVETAVAATEKRFGGFDVLVNTAGGTGAEPFVETDMAQFEFVLKLTWWRPDGADQGRVPALDREGREGAIINMASMGSYIPSRESGPTTRPRRRS